MIKKGICFVISRLPEEPTEADRNILYKSTKEEANLTSTIHRLNGEKKELTATKEDLRLQVNGGDTKNAD